MIKPTNHQDTFLNYARKEHVPITMFLISGFQIKGTVKGFDNFTVVMDSDGRQQLIYKHAISTIVPARPIPLILDENNPVII
ncbi:MAG: RNA chaperone Hfq [Oscillospiraceae bacterium]|nr:RNA chaperone Hfq [Oscillospiraceae bacterium]